MKVNVWRQRHINMHMDYDERCCYGKGKEVLCSNNYFSPTSSESLGNLPTASGSVAVLYRCYTDYLFKKTHESDNISTGTIWIPDIYSCILWSLSVLSIMFISRKAFTHVLVGQQRKGNLLAGTEVE